MRSSSRASPVRARLLGQPQDALADDILLDLRGARVDGAGPRPEEAVGPGAHLAHRGVDLQRELGRRAVGELAVGAEDLLSDLHEALLQPRVTELVRAMRA